MSCWQHSFTTIRTEGAILPPDLLQRVADGDKNLGGLTLQDYHLASGEKLNEAINRSWNRLLGVWTSFRAAMTKAAEGDTSRVAHAAGRVRGALTACPTRDTGTTLTRERWLLPLFQELGYGRLVGAKAMEIDGGAESPRPYPISHGWQHMPIHLVGFGVDLDRRTAGVTGASRSSPHSLVQEFLNRSQEHVWGLVSNGLLLRLLRDNASLMRQAYVEFDLQAMMDGEVYADFALLWLVCHQSRVEIEGVGNRQSGVGKYDCRLPTPHLRELIIKQWEVNHGKSISEILSRPESVARGDEVGRDVLSADKDVSSRRTVRDDITDTSSGGLGSSEHRGGLWARESRGLHSLSPDGAGFTERTGDTSDSIGASEPHDVRSSESTARTMRDRRQDVARSDSVTSEAVGSGESGLGEHDSRLPILDSRITTADSPLPIPPFIWDEERRAQLRAELDAYYAKLYGLTRDELRYILF